MIPGLSVTDYGDTLEEIRKQYTAHIQNPVNGQQHAAMLVGVLENFVRKIIEEENDKSKQSDV